jgi:hypothetical protein
MVNTTDTTRTGRRTGHHDGHGRQTEDNMTGHGYLVALAAILAVLAIVVYIIAPAVGSIVDSATALESIGR